LSNSKSPFKINTDGVLLAAWLEIERREARILDLGTGTGVIAIILSKRYPDSKIVAIDLSQAAIDEALSNFSTNNLKSITGACMPFQELDIKTFGYFDHIVSNPPFYQGGTRPNDNGLAFAKHSAKLTFQDILEGSVRFLVEDGFLSLILPVSESEDFLRLADNYGCSPERELLVSGRKELPCNRILLQLRKGKARRNIRERIWLFDDANRTRSRAYDKLVADYYLY